ncbi:MAG TPA: four helix bundle protein [Tepidisphaeraceae bacterium]|jgi:four helix bundle protein
MNDGSTLSRSEALQRRTKQFALRVIRLFKSIDRKNEEGRIIGRQLLRSGTSVGANYRGACRSRTTKEFVAKIRLVLEEADESVYWMELLVEGEIIAARQLQSLLTEAKELVAIFAASLRTARRRAPRPMAR